MRRAAIALVALALVVAPISAVAQSPAPQGAPWFEMAPGVSIQALAFIPGSPDPAIFRFRFDPGASVDLDGNSDVSLVTIDTGALTLSTDVPLVIFSTSDPGAAGRSASANSDIPLQAGDYFVVPPGAPGHLANPGTTEAEMSVANLPGPVAGASASPAASEAPASSAPPPASAAPSGAPSPAA